MKLWSDSYPEGGRLPEKYAFGKHHPDFHIEMCENISPHFAWSDVPVDTKTFVFTSHILNAPTDPENINVIGKFIPVDVDRTENYLWTCIDLPASTKGFDEGVFFHDITPRGKPGPQGPLGTRQGINGYTPYYEGKGDKYMKGSMRGKYFGYDGPCPPYNDAALHQLQWTLYAMDWDRCPIEGKFSNIDLIPSLEGHILEKATSLCSYAINPKAI